jgi:ComF family protein
VALVLAPANALIRVLLGPTCAACGSTLGRPLAGPVCERCWLSLTRLSAPLCAWCGDALPSRASGPLCHRCTRRQPPYDLARSGGRYDDPLRALVHALKYDGQRRLAEPLARWLRESAADVLAGADAVVPVPLHPLRFLERGFNQADDLAECLDLPVWRVLRRVHHGPPQASLPAVRRRTNVRRAFALRSGWSRVLSHRFRPPRLRNAVVVLVDDVMTTGATIEACSRVLREAGVRRVRVLTVARSVSTRPARPHLPRHRPAVQR